MRNSAEAGTPKLLTDYRPYNFTLSQVRLDVHLDPARTRIVAELDLQRRAPGNLVLDIGHDVSLNDVFADGVRLGSGDWKRTDEQLIVSGSLPASFTLKTDVTVDPLSNTTCEGLYLSGGIFCTQCEAEGFRHITPYPDRPDVMAPFRVTIHSDLPVLLSNGNPTERAADVAIWDDPWPKPAYLFALVAGDLRAVSETFKTMSGRDVDLNVWVRPQDLGRARFALDSLVKSMRWDESVYGREYDLDVFNIVAVDDFNMGAMENKGLNIFNSKLVLASPETATDADYLRIESVIAHEYFHNWTGNRITCREWFQLCLKEGLTVFRDQQFTADLRSAAVKRIEDVIDLRARQFPEDQGPLSHPVRPDSYVEINNFYTATIYQKGAELIGMLKLLVGEAGYRSALDLYFQRHDGDAATIEDWLKVFEDATGRDLAQFSRWYFDPGTPVVKMEEIWDDGALTLRLSQETPTPVGHNANMPRVIPFAIGLLSKDGQEVMPTRLLELTDAQSSYVFEGLDARPVVSALRGFSAPVILKRDISAADQALLFAHDTDPFARWEAGHQLALESMLDMAAGADPAPELFSAFGQLLQDDSADPAFRALCLRLPAEKDVARLAASRGLIPDPDAIHTAREAMAAEIARRNMSVLDQLWQRFATDAAYSADNAQVGARSIRLAALSLLNRVDNGERAEKLYDTAQNMTERAAALACLIQAGRADQAVADFYARFSDVRLVVDKWFTVQPLHAPPQLAVDVARNLAEHPDFDWQNPNRFRALIGGLTGNHGGFHRADGSGYAFVADWLLRMDAINPQIAARMSSAFESYARYDAGRREHAAATLDRILRTKGLSRNLHEMIARISGAGDAD